MIISPPFLPAQGLSFADPNPDAPRHHPPDPMMDAVDRFEMARGIYPIGFDRRWHAGMHLAPRYLCEKIHAIADGEVVAYRVCQQAFVAGGEQPDSNAGFVLLKHTTETGEGRTLTFYSLYMHLLDLAGYQRVGARAELLPEFLRMPTQGSGYGAALSAAAQPGGGHKVRRKDILGWPGQCQGDEHLHFEIFMTKADFAAYFGPTQLGRKQLTTPEGTDVWGSSYYVIPPQQLFLPFPVGIDGAHKLHGIAFPKLQVGQNTDTLYVEVWFHHGTKFTRVWREANDGHLELLTTRPIAEPDYEYDLYKRAMALYPACPSDGYELLRFGRILSTPATLPPEARTTWMRIAFAAGQEGYLDISPARIQKLSDADFPFFKSWKKLSEGDGPFKDDGMCDIEALKAILKDAKAHEVLENLEPELQEFVRDDTLVRYVKHTAGVREQLRGFVCEAPSEWDSTHNEARYRKLKEPGEFYHGNEAGYTKFLKFLQSFQFWEQTGLPAGEKLWFFHPMAFIRHFRKCGWLSESELRQMVPRYAPRKHRGAVALWEPVADPYTVALGSLPFNQRVPLNRMLHTFGITTPERMASFLGNAIQETQWFQKLHEGNSAARYAPWDGRGFLQLTWPSNYLAYWDFRGRSGDIPASVRTSLLEAQHSAQKSGSNAALLAVERHLPLELIKWRDDVQRATVEDASMSAGFYWARLRMAAYADQPHILERVSIATNHGPKIYYRSPSFWKTSACVNLPAALNYLYSARLNGFEARCAAYGYALAVLGEHRFPSSNQDAPYFPDSTEPGRI